jgi:hypothetical protein
VRVRAKIATTGRLRSRFGKMPHVERVLPNRDREGAGACAGLLVAERFHWIEPRGAIGRQAARDERNQ